MRRSLSFSREARSLSSFSLISSSNHFESRPKPDRYFCQYDVAFAVMGEEKKDELDKVVIKNDTLRKYFPRSFTPKQMEDTIIKLLDQWQRKQQRQNER